MQKNFPANKDPNVLIKECDKYFWHVEQSRVDVHPRDPRNIRTTTRIAIYRDKDFRRIFETEKWYKGSKIKVKTYKPACLIAGPVRIVHDPILQKQIDAEAAEFVKKMAAGKAAKDIKADDDLAQGTEVTNEGGDDSGTARRPRRKTN